MTKREKTRIENKDLILKLEGDLANVESALCGQSQDCVTMINPMGIMMYYYID